MPAMGVWFPVAKKLADGVDPPRHWVRDARAPNMDSVGITSSVHGLSL